MTPTATRLKLRLDERHAWFRNQWFFKWHHIGGEQTVEIDLFDGRHAYYAGICYSGSPQTVYWDAVARGVRKEIIEQFAWIEEAIRPYAREVALQALDECSGQLISFAHRIRRTAVEKDRILRGDGVRFPEPYDAGLWDGAEAQDINAQAQGLKRALFPIAEPRTTETPLNVPSPSTNRAYQVALSFAGEQRDYVDEVARWLAAKRIAVFYDKFEAVNLWGKDGVEHFHQVFAQDAQYVVMFISAEYVAKSWTRHERRAALSRQIAEDSEYVLPVRFDATEVPGIPSTLQYLDAKSLTPAELAALIAQKVGHGPSAGKASDMPPPTSQAVAGEVTFDYSAHDGRFIIGSGPCVFETMWSKASNESIHLYNDPPSIHGIAIAKGISDIDAIDDASNFDFSSRCRTPQLGEIAILRNASGFYAAVQVIKVDDDTRGAAADALTIRYQIQTNGSAKFKAGT
ncbi:MAG: molecular chaperone Tir [Blastomonas sp. CACIA14H2]|uniref:toll/interleukin-1 receptor domain-containing protein n=1 Tax=Blastomonas sp. CACIA14H2 TaxID=1419876 RepID=UPI0003D01B37|nr:MAG: molecular chaperone Tir [Blastomonas sp. CACIA14H2]